MSDAAAGPAGGRTSANGSPARLAPSVDRPWAEEFVIEQRLLGVPGDRIGDALVTVESHVRDSGESAQEAFGDPRRYGRELVDTHRETTPIDKGTIVGSLLNLLAAITLAPAFAGWLEGAPVSVTMGNLAVLGLVGVICVILFAAPSAVLRFLVDHRWVAPLLPVGLIAVLVGVLLTLPAEVATIPTGVVAAVGLAALIAGTVALWHQPTDLLVAPGEDQPGTSRGARLLTLAIGPGLIGLLLLMTWLLHTQS